MKRIKLIQTQNDAGNIKSMTISILRDRSSQFAKKNISIKIVLFIDIDWSIDNEEIRLLFNISFLSGFYFIFIHFRLCSFFFVFVSRWTKLNWWLTQKPVLFDISSSFRVRRFAISQYFSLWVNLIAFLFTRMFARCREATTLSSSTFVVLLWVSRLQLISHSFHFDGHINVWLIG